MYLLWLAPSGGRMHLPLFVIVTRAFHAIYRLFTSSHPRSAQPCQATSWRSRNAQLGVVGLTSGINLLQFYSRSPTGTFACLPTSASLSIRAYHLSFFSLTTSE
ncbi:hypothetical protein PspLS_07326 [Pyricularia sp. CBS 133598]|nr:hypothetical protein PspLS_07326 [Pyricularia sp. CBS 133598]